jgi:iron complex outermembrane receptor protein
VEANLVANPFPGFNIIAGYAHNEGKYTKADPDVQGRRPGSSGPADMANFWVSYRIATGAINGLGAGVGSNYAGKNVILSSVSQGEFTAPAYTTFKASVFYDRPRYRLSVNADNLTNQKYWIGWTTVNPQPLRSIYASATFRF